MRKSLPTQKVFLAILSGTLLTASFPPGNLGWMAWFALVPLLMSIEGASPYGAFKLGFIAGVTHYLSLIYWILLVLGHYGNLNYPASLGPLILLCTYLALFPALFSTFTAGVRGSPHALFLMGSSWVGLEYIRAKLLTGFPWCLLGYSQSGCVSFIQIADVTGVYGVSFLIVVVNGLLSHLLWKYRGNSQPLLRREILLTAVLVGATIAYGTYRLRTSQGDEGRQGNLRAAIIQPSIDQSLKWDPEYQKETMDRYSRLTRSAFAFQPDLIVWPETAVPFFFQQNQELQSRVLALARESGSILIFGSPAYQRTPAETKYYNRAYCVSPHDGSIQFYDKVHLVPFGEYIPFKRFLFFVDRLVPAAGDFAAGDRVTPIRAGPFSIGILICFEAIFPEIARAHARQGAALLTNLTNDAWFGMTSAPYQHLSMSVFRAVENRLPMIRAANTGFSAFIGPEGKIRALSGLFSQEILKGSLHAAKASPTFYTRFGDVFALFVLGLFLLRVVLLTFGSSRSGISKTRHLKSSGK